MKRRRSLAMTLFPAGVVVIAAMMVIPLPTSLLDLLLTLNIAAAVLLLLASLNVQRALDLAAFPSLLLILTLFRLALNVSSTRLILSQADAGRVIEAFGSFVIQGSIVVGLVVFLILVVIQFVVITSGGTRVAEVAARFTLDAMPGKQMAIDADLNAGIIDDVEAKRRREDISAEADFYGAMDGASKFVKGDAIAAIVITLINLVGGLIVGVLQLGMDVGEAAATYSLLTVGDGLVSQIPALLVSISAGLIITRAAGESDLGSDVAAQFARQHRAMRVGGVALCCLAAIPGLPPVPFLVVGGTALLVGFRLRREEAQEAQVPEEEALPAPPSPDDPEELARSMRVEPVSLELAVDLVDLVDPSAGGDLLDRVRGLRRKLALELGSIVPPVRTRDNVDLPLGAYVIRLHGVEVGRGTAPPGKALVIADDLSGIPGEEIREAVFGLRAKWIPVEQRGLAELAGGTVVDRASVITTHVAEVARTHASQLLSRQDVKDLLELARRSDPTVVDDLNAAGVGTAEVQRVLQDLLSEQVPIRDLVRILEVVSEKARVTRDPEALVSAVRLVLGPSIASSRAPEGRLAVLTLDPLVEEALMGALHPTDAGTVLLLDAQTTEGLARGIAGAVTAVEQRGEEPVLLCGGALRPALHRFSSRLVPHVPVLAYEELPPQLTIDNLGTVTVERTAGV